MSLNTLLSRLIQSTKFQHEYHNALIYSVRSQIPSVIFIANEPITIDWAYLISCSSLLARSSDGKILDMAYRICQAVICNSGLSKEYKSAAAIVFGLSANSSAIRLSIDRKLVDTDYDAIAPHGINLDVKRKEFCNSIVYGSNYYVLNEFQKEVYSAFETSYSISVSAPTSSGKSFILIQILADYISENKYAKIVYIVPTRALIQQVEMDIRKHLKQQKAYVDVSSVPVLPENFGEKACVFILTQERLQWILSEHTEVRFDLVIVDEAHKIGDYSRGILLQQVIQQVSYANHTRFLFASPMTENPGELFRAIKPEPNREEVVSEIITVNQNLFWVTKASSSTTKWNIELISQGKKDNLGYIECERITKVSMRLPILAYKISSGKKGNLLYVNGAAEAERVAFQLKSLILNDNPDYSPTQKITDLIALIKRTVHRNYVLVETLKAGVAFHYGNMPLAIRNEIENLFRKGDISFLVCTSTLIEGVNLPAKSIFVRGPQKGRKIPMNDMDFWNLAGRAGRQGKEFQGNVFCIDADDTSVWTNGTPTERKNYRIKSTIDAIIDTKLLELLKYIRSKQTTTDISEMDYAYTYFLDAYNRYGSVVDSPLTFLYGDDVCRKLDSAFSQALLSVAVPADVLSRNLGVNPLAQQNLFNYFLHFDRDTLELVPPYPEDDDAQEKYMHIIGRISKHLTGDSYRLNAYRAVLITNWLRGYGLARIISDNIRWHSKNSTHKTTAAIIRDTMRDIEEYARFRFLKYTSCYIDVLKLYLSSIGDTETIEKIPQLNLWLELGASKKTQISLMSMGFTRTAALELSDLIVNEEYTKEQCYQWLKTNNLESLGIPNAIMNEAINIMLLL